ncbi:MAG: PilN domain-containing protein, partial [Deltaproteobacteria bacterium]|nr:PilN domain-containing protein [Deltaproteobacteria bacterium]
NGIALDEQTIALFMSNLERGQFFGNVDLVLATEYVQDEIKLKQFSVSVALKDPLKANDATPEELKKVSAEPKSKEKNA